MSSKYEKAIFVTILILFSLFGAYMADVVFHYQILANGVLGVTVIYLALRKRPILWNDGKIEKIILMPNRLRFLVSVCVLTFLLTLAGLTVFKAAEVLIFK